MLTQEDYKVILAVLDAGSQKGIFRPGDFSVIGNLYGKVQMLSEAPEPPKAPQQAATTTTTATTTLNPQ